MAAQLLFVQILMMPFFVLLGKLIEYKHILFSINIRQISSFIWEGVDCKNTKLYDWIDTLIKLANTLCDFFLY